MMDGQRLAIQRNNQLKSELNNKVILLMPKLSYCGKVMHVIKMDLIKRLLIMNFMII